MDGSVLYSLLDCFHICLKLKTVLRSGFVNCQKNRKESVAEHSWMLSLMVLFVAPYLDRSFSLLKALKLALIHDLGECLIGDISLLSLLKDKNLMTERHKEEEQALGKILGMLEENLGKELLELWNDFEERSSYEAKVVAALDRIEAQVQQNESKESFLNDFKREGVFDKIDPIFTFDHFINKLKETVLEEHKEKLNEYQ